MNGRGIRTGLVGLGRMGARLAKSAERVGCSVVAAHDIDPACFALSECPALRPVFTREPGKFWSTPMELLLVATTAPSHVRCVKKGLAYGIRRYLVEKPFCVSIDEANDVRRVAFGSDARIVVNHGRRYCPNYAALEAMDGSSELGRLRGISATLGAGGLGCVGVHYLELFCRLFGGRPRSVNAAYAGTTPPNPRGGEFVDPGACALMLWPDGRRALLDMSDDTGIPPALEFRFTFGRVVIEDESRPWRVLRRTTADRDQPLSRYGLRNEEAPLPNFAPFGLFDMAEAAIRDALGDGPVNSGIEPALDAFTTFVAIRKSADSGAVVQLPLPPDDEARRFPIP